jgi:S-layer homology domain
MNLAKGMVGPNGTVPVSGTVPSVGSYNCSLGGNSLFGDVPPTDGGCRFIHYIYAQGLTEGCGGGNYCPASNVTRWQMAVFLAIAMAGSGAAVPPSGTVPLVGSYNCILGGNSLFGDVLPTDSGCRFIHYIYANGVTAGCGGGNYCPASNVTRWQMAVFLVNAFHMPFLH